MQQSQNSQTWKIWVEGQVQGVGYRRFAQKVAVRLGLAGWVRNCSDGRVELRVQATTELLDALMRELKKGPMHGEVKRLASEAVAHENMAGFEIRPDA